MLERAIFSATRMREIFAWSLYLEEAGEVTVAVAPSYSVAGL